MFNKVCSGCFVFSKLKLGPTVKFGGIGGSYKLHIPPLRLFCFCFVEHSGFLQHSSESKALEGEGGAGILSPIPDPSEVQSCLDPVWWCTPEPPVLATEAAAQSSGLAPY